MTSEWKTSPLRDLVGFISKGIAPSYADEESETTVRVLNQKCNRNFRITYSESRLHDLARKKVPAERFVRIDDILINSTGAGTAGRIAQICNLPCDTIVDGHMIIIRANDKVSQKYLGYAMKAHQWEVLQLDEGSTGQTELNRERLLDEIMISYPTSFALQETIVKTLEGIDRKLLINEKVNDNLQQQAAAIFRSWFVDCAPFGGKAPDEWENVTLEDITALVSRGITPKYADDTDQIVINQKCIRNHTIDLSLARTHTPKIINEKWLRFGDLLINSTGDGTLGRAAQVWFQPKNLTVDSHVTIARPAKENLIFYIGLWGILHEKEIESLHTGSTGQTELPRDRVKAMELLLPDNETLDRFNGLITPMAAAIVANQEENNRLAALRDAILPKLMSGEIDVTDIQL
jgi:type I restriction enzyme S subunit